MNHRTNTSTLTPLILILVLALIALMQLSTDLYTPSFPDLQKKFNTSLGQVQLSLSLFMLGFSCAHPVFGPLSDKIGRKTPLLCGISLNVLGSLICFLSPSITVLIIGRFLQGFGIGSCNSVGRSLGRDLLNGNELAKLGAQIGMVSVLFLALSPTLGGYIQQIWGWRADFVFLLVFGIVLWCAVWRFLPETNKNLNPHAMQLSTIVHNSYELLSNKQFMGYSLCSCLAGAGVISYVVIAPFIFQQTMGLTSVEFGWLAFVIAGGIFISGILNHLFVMKKGIKAMLLVGCLTMFLSGALLLLYVITNAPSLFIIMTLMAFYSIGSGLTFMNAFPGAFEPFPHSAGIAGALYASMQDLSAALISSLIAFLNITNIITLGLILTSVAFLSLICYVTLIRGTGT